MSIITSGTIGGGKSRFSLESSLLHAIGDELSYRLALRGSALLSQRHEPSETYRMLRSLYNARSSIVHKGKTVPGLSKEGKIEGLPWTEYVPRVEDLVRAVLRTTLSRIGPQTSLSEITREIDARILQGLRPDCEDSSQRGV